ncbi:MAG TPA: hypothetical protein VFZ83_14070 [Acidimicrobiia bacterium]|nr:hypothetical protein [Acidimicrobiia bacterium]
MRSLRAPLTRPDARRRRIAVLTAVAVVTLGLGACSGDDSDDPESSAPTTGRVEGVDVALERGPVTVFGVADGAVLPDAAARAAMAGAERYVQSAIVSPFARGEVGDRFAPLFAPALQPLVEAGGRDHGALTDDGIPAATETPTLTTSPVALDALVAADGTPLIVIAAFRARIAAETDGGPVAVGRVVELTFERTGGEWLVTAYDVSATRRGIDAAPTSTTATAGTEDAT